MSLGSYHSGITIHTSSLARISVTTVWWFAFLDPMRKKWK